MRRFKVNMNNKLLFISFLILILMLNVAYALNVPVTENSSILPTIAYTNDTLLGYCNVSDLDGDNITFEYSWYVDGTQVLGGPECYQETATTATDCGGLSTGSYSCNGPCTAKFTDYSKMIDGSFSTFGYASTRYIPSIIYITYKVPDGASPDKWYYKYDGGGGYLDISGCPYDTEIDLQVTLLDNNAVTSYVKFYCNGGSTLLKSGTGISVYRFYEEAIYWDFGDIGSQTENGNYNVDNLSSSYFVEGDEIIFSSRGYDGTNYSDWLNSSTLTISNIAPVVETVNITPIVAYSNDTLLGYCNVSDLDGDNITFEYNWYINDILNESGNMSEYCYQETANISTLCGGLDIGNYSLVGSLYRTDIYPFSYFYDGDWGTRIQKSLSSGVYSETIVYINYSKPTNSYGATWKTADSVSTNITEIPLTCFSQSNLQLRVNVTGRWNQGGPSCGDSYYSTEDAYFNWDCYNGSDWQTLVRNPIDCSYSAYFYEDAINWSIYNEEGINTYVSSLSSINFHPLDNIIFECRGKDGINYSAWTNSSVTQINNRGLLSFSNLAEDSDSTTEIGSIIKFTASAELYDIVDTCQLIIKPTTSLVPFDIENMLITGTTDINMEYNFTISSSYTAEYDNITWWISCNDTSGNFQNSTVQNLSIGAIGDYTNPVISVDTITYPILNNGTVVDNIFNNLINISTTFTDFNLFQASVNITCAESGQIYYWEILDINTTEYNFSELIDLAGLPIQRCNITLSSSDDHTTAEIPVYEHTVNDNTISYKTENNLEVSITSTDIINKANTEKLIDRYNFKFEYDDSKLVRRYVIESTGLLFTREDTLYPGHFVVWNPETHKGNWIDFALPNSNDYNYIVNKINSNKYEIIIVHKVLSNPENKLNFKTVKTPSLIDKILNLFTNEKPLDINEIEDTNVTFLEEDRELTIDEIDNVVDIEIKNETQLKNLEDDYGIKEVTFNSIGGTNIEEVKTYFYIGGVFNITSNNKYDDSSFTNYTVNIDKTDLPTASDSYFFNVTSQNYIENVKAGNYDIELTHPNYVSVDYSVTMETQYDECEQQLANVSTVCGGFATGSYAFSDVTDLINESNLFDSNESTYASVVSFNNTYIYVNYTIPSNVTFAGWKVTAFGLSSSVEIPLDTDNKTTLQLRIIASDNTGNNYIKLQEYNGTSWYNLTYIPLQVYDSQLFEEKIIWYTQTENQIDLVFNSSESLITFVYRNINTLLPVDDYSINVTNENTSVSDIFNITDGSSGITLSLNANVIYNITFSKTGYNDQSETYTFNYQQVETFDIYLTYLARLNILNEATLEEFDFTDPITAQLLLKCDDNGTNTYDLIALSNSTNSSNSTIPIDIIIDCKYENFKFLLTYAGGGSYYRTLIVDYETSINGTYYLIDLDQTPFVYGTFIIDDLFGQYENPSVYIKKSIPGETVDIQSDYTDIENKVGYYLIENNEYIIEVHSDNKPIQVIGKYSADVGGEKVLSMYDINLDSETEGFYNNVQYTIKIVNDSGIQNVLFDYNDADNLTDSIQLRIYADSINGTLIYESSVYTSIAELGSVLVPITGYENRTLVGDIEVIHSTGVTNHISRLINKEWGLNLGIMDYVSQDFLNWFFILLLSVIAIYASINTNWAALSITGLAVLFVLFGWFALSVSVLVLAIVVAIADALISGGKK